MIARSIVQAPEAVRVGVPPARERARNGKGWRNKIEMCGRVVQASGPLSLAIVDGLDVRDSRLTNVPRRFNAAPSQELLVIRQNQQNGERSLDFLRWGLIPYWCSDPMKTRRPPPTPTLAASKPIRAWGHSEQNGCGADGLGCSAMGAGCISR
jgi:hypothetical protein